MPSKYTIRVDYEGGFYHVFNRGVEKRIIFLDKQDYAVFIYYLKSFLSDPALLTRTTNQPISTGERRKNYNENVTLIAYCLMPNHFHLFLRQDSQGSLAEFMQSISNAYTKYFNTKYERVGSLFQGRFKASNVENDSYYSYITKYIHLNPKSLAVDPENYDYSSYKYYLNSNTPTWLHPDVIIGKDFTINEYRDFVSDVLGEALILDGISDIQR